MANLKDVIYLSNEDYETLVSTGTVTIDGQTLTYDENCVYITPDKLASSTEDGLMSAADKSKLDGLDDSNLVHKTGNETINGNKTFGSNSGAVTTTFYGNTASPTTIDSNGFKSGQGNLPVYASKFVIRDEGSTYLSDKATYDATKITFRKNNSGTFTTYDLSFPDKSGTLATTDYVVANPSSTTASLTGITINGTNYAVSSANQTVKGNGTAFNAGDAVDIVPGTNITVTAATTGTGAPKITISSTDTGATSVETTGSGNAVTTASYDSSNRKLTLTKGTTFLTAESDTLSTVLTRGNTANKDIDLNYHDFFNAGVQKTAYNYSTSQDPNTQYWWYQIVPPSGSQSDRYLICVEGDENYPRGRGTFILDVSKYSTNSYNVSLNNVGSTMWGSTHLLQCAIDASGNVYIQANAAWSSYLRFIRHNSNTTTQSYTQVGKAAFGTAAGFTSLKMIADCGTIRLYNGAIDTSTSSAGFTTVDADKFREGGTYLEDKYLGKTAKAADADKLDGNDSSYFINTSSTAQTKSGNLTLSGTTDVSGGTLKLRTINAPTTSGGTTYGAGSNGQVLKSNGTTVYWASDSNTNYYPSRSYSSGLQISTSQGVADTCALYVPSASSTQSGVINTAAQTFSGLKTLKANITPAGDLTGYTLSSFISAFGAGNTVCMTGAGSNIYWVRVYSDSSTTCSMIISGASGYADLYSISKTTSSDLYTLYGNNYRPFVTTNTAQTISGAKTFTGTVGNTQTSAGVYLGLDENSTPNANMAIVSANNAAYIDMGRPNVDYDFRIIKWNETNNVNAQLCYGGNASGTITIPTGKNDTMAVLGDIGNGTLTINANGTSAGTFTANQSGNTTVNLNTAEVIDVTDGVTSAIQTKITNNPAIMLKYGEYYYMPQYDGNASGFSTPNYYNCFEGDGGAGTFHWLYIDWDEMTVEENTSSYATSSALNNKVSGPSSSTDKAIAIYDGTGGKTIKNTNLIIDGTTIENVITPSQYAQYKTQLHFSNNQQDDFRLSTYYAGIQSKYDGPAILPANNSGSVDNAIDLGYYSSASSSQQKRWRNLYLAGNLSDGTNSVSIANIVTKNTTQTISGNKTFSGTNTHSGTTTFSGSTDFTGSVLLKNLPSGSASVKNSKLGFQTSIGGALSYTYLISPSTGGSDKNIYLPSSSGTLSLQIDIVDLRS